MCGICGVAWSSPDRTIDPETLGRMTGIMGHRGPDSDGFLFEPGVGLGIRRLSIIDLETGDQPLSNEDGTVSVFCNGEIYNFVELRRDLLAGGHRLRSTSDTEVMVHLYEDLGPDFIRRLRGMFAFALWDSRRRLLMLGRDRLGIKPLYYHSGPEGLSFGSEVKPILLSGQVTPTLDPHALRDLFTFGYIQGARTLFASVKSLEPGHYLVFRDGRLLKTRYWQLPPPTVGQGSPSMDDDSWAEAFLEKLRESIKIHLRSDVPVGAWLSGGIDSSIIVALMGEFLDRPVETFSLAFENKRMDEVGSRSTLASFPGYSLVNNRVTCMDRDFELLPRAVWHSENPSATGMEILQLILSRFSSRKFKVILTGEGSDEILGGYGWFRADKLYRPLARLPRALRRMMLMGSLLPRLRPYASRTIMAPREMGLDRYRALTGQDFQPSMKLLSEDLQMPFWEEGSPDNGPPTHPDGYEKWSPYAQLQFYDMTLRLPGFILNHLDHMTMASSLEARVPFLDHELVELCAGIPSDLKLKGMNEKYVLRRAAMDILPEEIVKRKKRGLWAPHAHWLRDKLPDFAEEMLSESTLRRKGYFDPPEVRSVLQRHREGRGRYTMELMAILVTQLWDEIFVGGPIDKPPS